jgi:hypothetical protein
MEQDSPYERRSNAITTAVLSLDQAEITIRQAQVHIGLEMRSINKILAKGHGPMSGCGITECAAMIERAKTKWKEAHMLLGALMTPAEHAELTAARVVASKRRGPLPEEICEDKS